MNGIHRVLPNETAQPEFKEALVKAAKAGVQIVCYSCHVEADSIKITGVVGDLSLIHILMILKRVMPTRAVSWREQRQHMKRICA